MIGQDPTRKGRLAKSFVSLRTRQVYRVPLVTKQLCERLFCVLFVVRPFISGTKMQRMLPF